MIASLSPEMGDTYPLRDDGIYAPVCISRKYALELLMILKYKNRCSFHPIKDVSCSGILFTMSAG